MVSWWRRDGFPDEGFAAVVVHGDGCPEEQAGGGEEEGGKGGKDDGASGAAAEEGQEETRGAKEEDDEEGDERKGSSGVVEKEKPLEPDGRAEQGEEKDCEIDALLGGGSGAQMPGE